MTKALRFLLLELLDLFRVGRSALGGPSCRFHPSCTQYARHALERLPLPRAGALVVARLLRCHPFHPGGWDPVPAR
ncbi:MAG: membrane protein insertion efficiency factor YidD [Elusimicrobia bacterium]|nr:membrane protein insertion efficiency factor YidD [Elusimicrobiota bacterium]